MRGVRDRIRRYVAFLRWFARDAFYRYRFRLGAIAGGSMAGLALQAAAVSLTFRYAHALERDSTLQLFGHAFAARSSFGLLAAVATAFLVLVICAALIIMRARLEGISLARRYGDYCSQRIYALASRLSPAVTVDPNNAEPGARFRIRDFAWRDARFCGVALRIAVSGILPLGTALASAVALVALDAALSLILFGVLLLALVFLYRISLRGASYLGLLKSQAGPAARDRSALSNRLVHNPAELRPSDTGMAAIFLHGAAAKAGDAMVGQRQVVERGIVVAQIAIGCALFLILLVQGSATLRSEHNWSALLAYLTVFTIFASSASTTARLAVSMNRFYPSLSGYARFVQRFEAPVVAQPPAARYRLEAESLEAHGASLEVSAGERLALVIGADVDRYNLAPLARALRGLLADGAPAGLVSPWFATGLFVPLAGTLRENFGLPPGYQHAQLDADLAALGLAAVPQSIRKALDRPLRTADRQAFEPSLVFALLALSGIRGDHRVLVLEEKALAALPPLGADALLDMAQRCLVVIAYAAGSHQALGSRGERALIVGDAERLLGWSSIGKFRAGDPAVLRAISEVSARRPAGREGELGDEGIDELA
jgi:hypothetical protein